MIRLLTSASIFLAATPSLAQDDAPPPYSSPRQNPPAGYGAEHRHLGFYLRMDLGIGYVSTSFLGGNGRMDGGAGALSFAIGGAVSEGWIVAAHLWATGTGGPKFHPGNGGPTTSLDGSSLTIAGIGPQLTHYFADNLYFSVTPSITGGPSTTTSAPRPTPAPALA